MPDGQKPGTVCLYCGASEIDSGTLARVCSPRPGTIGSHSFAGPEADGTISAIEVQLQDASARRDWRRVQKTLAMLAEALAEDLARELSREFGHLVFYTDGLGEKATIWAELQGRVSGSQRRVTIDMTDAGQTLTKLTKPLTGQFRWVEDLRPAWTCLSERMATLAQGEVHVFARGRKAEELKIVPSNVRMPQPPLEGERRKVVIGAGSVFWEIEYPELLKSLQANSKVTRIKCHPFDVSGAELGPPDGIDMPAMP